MIKRPMCLDKVTTKLYGSNYKSAKQFREDVMLVWRNAMTYNPPYNQVHIWAKTLEKLFKEEMAKRYDSCDLPIEKKKAPITRTTPPVKPVKAIKKKLVPEPLLTDEQLQRIENHFSLLPQSWQDKAIDIIQPECDEGDEIELEIDALSTSVQKRLYEFMDDYFHFDKKDGLPDVCESEEEKDVGPPPPLDVHRPPQVAPVTNPFAPQTAVSNPFARSDLPASKPPPRKPDTVKADSSLWKVAASEPKREQAKRDNYFKTLKKPPELSMPPPLQPAPKSAPQTKKLTNKLPPIPKLQPVKTKQVTKQKLVPPPPNSSVPIQPPPPPPPVSTPAPTTNIIPTVNLNEQRDLMTALDDLL